MHRIGKGRFLKFDCHIIVQTGSVISYQLRAFLSHLLRSRLEISTFEGMEAVAFECMENSSIWKYGNSSIWSYRNSGTCIDGCGIKTALKPCFFLRLKDCRLEAFLLLADLRTLSIWVPNKSHLWDKLLQLFLKHLAYMTANCLLWRDYYRHLQSAKTAVWPDLAIYWTLANF